MSQRVEFRDILYLVLVIYFNELSEDQRRYGGGNNQKYF
ncbi:hypothetical protein DET49_11247 [Salegentibacter sp. 24]|nr:hypothetical protein DET49_11247 [Salegentibacter sp. 24]